MPVVEWKLSEKQAEYLYDKHRYLVVEGSAGSGKTLFACHKVLMYAFTHKNAKIGVFRLTLPSLKQTAWLEIRQLLDKYDLPYQENKTEGVMTFPNGTTIIFRALDDMRKIRSLNMDFIYCEQAEEIDKDVFMELDSRVRGQASIDDYGQLLLVVTPEMQSHWIYKRFHKLEDEDACVVHFHYTENPFVDDKYIKMAEDRKKFDYDTYARLTLGKWGLVGDIIYQNWDIKESSRGFEYYTGGSDFGFNNPSCFLLVGWLDNEAYIIDEVYERNLINYQFIGKVNEMLKRNNLNPSNLDTVYGDKAEPDRIQEFNEYGYNMVGGIKDVNAKINATKSVKIHISPKCVNTIKEIENYCYQRDKDGNAIDKPIKYNDHSMDALGYCVYGTVGILSPERSMPEKATIYGY